MEKARNVKSHLWLQEPGEFPSAEATLCEKKLEMSFCWKMKMHIGHRPGPGPGLLGGTRLSGPAQGAGLPPALRRGVAAWPRHAGGTTPACREVEESGEPRFAAALRTGRTETPSASGPDVSRGRLDLLQVLGLS